jgi:hypothetical protein
VTRSARRGFFLRRHPDVETKEEAMNQLDLSHANAEISRRLADAATRRRARLARPRPSTRHRFAFVGRRG